MIHDMLLDALAVPSVHGPDFCDCHTFEDENGGLHVRRCEGLLEQARAVEKILSEYHVVPKDEWEYGVRWGDEPDDSRPAICDSRAHAESRAAASHGDKVMRRRPRQVLPPGEWEEVSDE